MNPPSFAISFLNNIRGLRRKTGGGGFTGHCPGHDDRHSSLSIDFTADRILLRCFTGCTVETICGALGLAISELFIAADRPTEAPQRRQDAHSAAKPTVAVDRIIRYGICDTEGHRTAEHLRYDRTDGSKSFAWHRNGKDNLDGIAVTDLPLYGSQHLGEYEGKPAWLRQGIWIITEGEKAACALLMHGIPALGTLGASITPADSILASLDQVVVYLWPDNDPPGRLHMDRIAACLADKHGWPFVIHWEQSPQNGDAYDYFEEHPEATLETIVAMARLWEPDRQEPNGDFRTLF